MRKTFKSLAFLPPYKKVQTIISKVQIIFLYSIIAASIHCGDGEGKVKILLLKNREKNIKTNGFIKTRSRNDSL